jgi:hypothetical protein
MVNTLVGTDMPEALDPYFLRGPEAEPEQQLRSAISRALLASGSYGPGPWLNVEGKRRARWLYDRLERTLQRDGLHNALDAMDAQMARAGDTPAPAWPSPPRWEER